MNQIFVDCNRFNKDEVNEVRIEWTIKEYRNKTDKTRTKLTETTLTTPTIIHTNKTIKHQNKV